MAKMKRYKITFQSPFKREDTLTVKAESENSARREYREWWTYRGETKEHADKRFIKIEEIAL